MSTTENREKYTCLFGGGGARGFAYCGTLQALEELNVDIGMVGGSSVGSIFAALIAAGYNSNELKDIFKKANFELFRDIHIGFGGDFALSKGEIFTEWLRELLQKKVWAGSPEKRNQSVTFRDIKLPLVVITTNISTFKCQEFSQIETPDYDVAQAVRISCSMPGLMTPVNYNGTKLVDGDLQKSMPMWKLSGAVNKCRDRIIEFRLEGDYSGKEKNAIDFLNTVYSCMMNVGTEFVSNIYRKNDRFECVKINTRNTNIVDFNMSSDARNDLYSIGYDDVMNYFRHFLPLKRRFLLEKYKTLFILLKSLEIAVTGKNVGKIKSALGELFVELSDCRDNIDELIFTELIGIKNAIKDSMYQGFWGESFRADSDLSDDCKHVTSEVLRKVKELETRVREA